MRTADMGLGDMAPPQAREIQIPPYGLTGFLSLPLAAQGIVLFAHGSGSSRFSPRNARVARALGAANFGTLLFDLLSPHEADDRHKVFDIALLASRLDCAITWCSRNEATKLLPIGLFGASTGAAAALVAAASRPGLISAVVSRGGRPDLAGGALRDLKAPTLLIVGALDEAGIELNRRAMNEMSCTVELAIVPRATHLFDEPGTLEAVIDQARHWFQYHLSRSRNAGA